MNRAHHILTVWTTILLPLAACGPKHTTDIPPGPPPVSLSPTDGLDLSIHPDETPVPADAGFTFDKLLPHYCNVTLKADVTQDGKTIAAGTTLLINYNDMMPDFIFYYRGADGTPELMKNGFDASGIQTSSCDLKNLQQHQEYVMLAALPLYTNTDHQGDPVCTLPAGPLPDYLDADELAGLRSFQYNTFPHSSYPQCPKTSMLYSARFPTESQLVAQF